VTDWKTRIECIIGVSLIWVKELVEISTALPAINDLVKIGSSIIICWFTVKQIKKNKK